MTGVLPIAKYSSVSALNMFREYNILNDVKYSRYFGFTSEEVEYLCKKQDKVKLEKLKTWYNGYKSFSGEDIYNPRSVLHALSDGVCQSYWTNTGPMDEISYYIENNVEAVRDDIVRMASGIPVNIYLRNDQKRCQIKSITENGSSPVLLFIRYLYFAIPKRL